MGEEAAKRFGADFAFANVFVAVHTTAERNFGVVDMEDRDALEADGAVDEFERGGEAGFALDVVARGEQMRGVETRADLQALHRVQHFAEFFQARAERGAHAGGIFEQNAQRSCRQIFRRLLDRFYGEAQGLIRFALAADAWMRDDEFSAERDAANELVVKRLDGAGAQHGLLRGEIDQIVGVDDQRAEAELLAASAESRGVDLRNARRTAGPHARAGGKNLQGVAAELVRGVERVAISAGDGGADANAQATVHPSGRYGCGLRFGAVFVFRIE